MANRHVRFAIMAGLLTINLAGIAAANGRAQEATIPEKGEATLVGCFLRERIHNDDKYVLADARVGHATSVTAAACSASGGTGRMIKLEKVKKHHLEVVNVGQWVEVTGDLRKMHKHADLQDMHVTSFRPVPVIVPVAEALPAPEPPRLIPEPTAAPQADAPAPPAPVATTGVMAEKHHRLPASASSLPLTALIGFGALASGLMLLVNSRRAAGRS